MFFRGGNIPKGGFVILDVDVGNTQIKWRQSPAGAVQTVLRTEEEVLWDRWQDLSPVARVRIACVASQPWRDQFQGRCQHLWRITPEFARVTPGVGGLSLAYQAPETLGVDRWLKLLGARHQWPQKDCLIMDSGSALTLDLLTAAGEHLGGYIVPGVGMSSRALFANTDGVPAAALELVPEWQPGTSTINCVRYGFSALYGGLVREVWGRAQELLENPLLVYCGGDAPLLKPLLPADATLHYEPSLVLQGLVLALP